MKVGVGASVRFVRKQHGLLSLRRRPGHEADELCDALLPQLGDPGLGIAGLHLFTLDELVATWRWSHERRAARAVA
jgi:methylenetetrahydrofolate reductase (NADPH)